jgi:hypothetical protein
MMLAMERFGRRRRGLFLARVHCLTFTNYHQGLHASPPVLLDNEDDDSDDPSTVLKDVPPPSTAISLS